MNGAFGPRNDHEWHEYGMNGMTGLISEIFSIIMHANNFSDHNDLFSDIFIIYLALFLTSIYSRFDCHWLQKESNRHSSPDHRGYVRKLPQQNTRELQLPLGRPWKAILFDDAWVIDLVFIVMLLSLIERSHYRYFLWAQKPIFITLTPLAVFSGGINQMIWM